MKTIEISLYKLEELSEEAKQTALQSLSDINVDNNWWDFNYEDADNIGLIITGFDLGRRNDINGEFKIGAIDCARSILKEHGDTCQTYKDAQTFLTEWEAKEKEWDIKRQSEGFDSYDYDDDYEGASNEFLDTILSDYLTLLREEYDYRISEEAIIETIEANDYDFTEDGKIY